MPETAALSAVAARHGIEPRYVDIWGNTHETSPRTEAALLSCMGRAAHEKLARPPPSAAEEIVPHAILPSVLVRRVSDLGAPIALHLPERLAPDALAWRIVYESGESERGPLDIAVDVTGEEPKHDGERYRAYAFRSPQAPLGYHRLELWHGAESVSAATFIVAPDRCYWPKAVEGSGRVWGPSVQLYSVRSERNWGMGDFTDLRMLLEQWAGQGASVVAVNPLHALFPHNPQHISPYSPSSRLFVNPLYLDVERVPELRDSEEAQRVVTSVEFGQRVQALRALELIDHAGVAQLKMQLLELVYTTFRAQHLARDTDRARAFRAFQHEQGEPLHLHALFEALQEHFHRQDPGVWGWPVWPEPYREPTSDAVRQFAQEHVDRVEFYAWLQWLADEQLAEVGRRAESLHLGVGLYGDLAVSVDRAGSEAWANQAVYALEASIGAPPDDFSPAGQNWGLPPPIPERMRAAAYAPLIAMLRRNMRHNGALRIDHVMGLLRLFWIPPGGIPSDGAYVRYPLDDLLGIVALESVRNRCLIIGEDLGTVPDELRTALAESGMLSYRLLYFERESNGDFKAPRDYPAQALVAVSTHDLPTLAGFWEGRDMALRQQFNLFPTEQAREQRGIERAEVRARLLLALEREKLLPAGATVDPVSLPQMTPELACALHVFLARTPARIMLVQLEDALLVPDQVNLPGSGDAHPNWRRKLPIDLERWPRTESLLTLSAALRETRPAQQRAAPPGRTPQAIVPRATYRLQFHRGFTFRDATALVPYLAKLGVSHVYASPYLRARPGSTHGYDIIDHNALNPEIGTREEFERFVEALRAHGMGQILDVVPNHMGVMGADNAWWLDVLENGPASMFADFFDIDWNPPNRALAGKVLVPVLGQPYGEALETNALEVAFDAEQGAFSLTYYAHRLPIDPRQYSRILERALRLVTPGELPDSVRAELETLIDALIALPPREAVSPEQRTARHRGKEVHKRHLAALVGAWPGLASAIEAALKTYRGTPGTPASFDALHELLEEQAYRLAYWRVASDEINYRRFFDINDLAALRMENEAVFDATHRLVLELLAQGKVDGLRIDHPDGLFDPAQYFRRLQERYAAAVGGEALSAAQGRDWPLYLLIEKITAGHERIPESWPVYGTTGYRYANVLNGLFVDTRSEAKMLRTYRAFIGDDPHWQEVAYQSRLLIMRTALASELTVLTNHLLRIAQSDRRTRDFTFNTLRYALVEVVAAFPVYRTYVAQQVSAEDRRYIEWAVSLAKRRSRAADASIFDFILSVLLAQPLAGAPAELEAAMRAFTAKLQQFTAPVTAKGVEDTAFYRYVALVSLNEVGGDPGQFGMGTNAFHGASLDRARNWPHTMLASSTHDTKRSEDARLRVNVLSEIPAVWRLALRRWSRLNRSKRKQVDGAPAPSRNDEYLLYQTLVASFPQQDPDEAGLTQYRARIEGYMLKAVREAKLHTSWINPSQEYEQALTEFVGGLLGKREGNLFLDDFTASLRWTAWLALLSGLSHTLVKLTSPGVPDIYQGTELWDLSLVDPDNRRPIDYEHRQRLLEGIEGWAGLRGAALIEHVHKLLAQLEDGAAKLYVTWRTLALRREHEALFRHGNYQPLEVRGARAENLAAYARVHEGQAIVVLAPRLYAGLAPQPGSLPLGEAAWEDTRVDVSPLPPADVLVSVLDGREINLQVEGQARELRVAEALTRFPVGLLRKP